MTSAKKPQPPREAANPKAITRFAWGAGDVIVVKAKPKPKGAR